MVSHPGQLVAKLLDVDEREFWKVCLPGAKLQGQDLSGVDWNNGNMTKACLDGAILRGASFHRCKLTEASFKGAVLTEACLRSTDLRGALFQGADLKEADLGNANLSQANLAGADLRGADLSGAKIDGANFSGAILDEVQMSEKAFNNQGIPFNPTWRIYTWEGLRFRSKNEIEIAKALDEAGVLFLPLCLARLNTSTGRRNLEPDFLVCHQGKWGLLEVDGPYHTPSTRVTEQGRERFFQHHGVRVIQRFDAKRCEEQPDAVVKEFLELIEKMH